MPQVVVIEVSDWLMEHTPELRIQLAGTQIACRSGEQLGALYVGSPGITLDYCHQNSWEESGMCGLCASARFRQMDVQCRWTSSNLLEADTKKPTIRRNIHRPGLLLQCRRVDVSRLSTKGVFANNCVYERVTGWNALEPALTRTEETDIDAIWRCTSRGMVRKGDREALHRLVESLGNRRGLIRRPISIFRESARNPFPNWRDSWPRVGMRMAYSRVLQLE
jgi:hypothetical protein